MGDTKRPNRHGTKRKHNECTEGNSNLNSAADVQLPLEATNQNKTKSPKNRKVVLKCKDTLPKNNNAIPNGNDEVGITRKTRSRSRSRSKVRESSGNATASKIVERPSNSNATEPCIASDFIQDDQDNVDLTVDADENDFYESDEGSFMRMMNRHVKEIQGKLVKTRVMMKSYSANVINKTLCSKKLTS